MFTIANNKEDQEITYYTLIPIYSCLFYVIYVKLSTKNRIRSCRLPFFQLHQGKPVLEGKVVKVISAQTCVPFFLTTNCYFTLFLNIFLLRQLSYNGAFCAGLQPECSPALCHPVAFSLVDSPS